MHTILSKSKYNCIHIFLRSLGVDVKKYKESCLKNDIELIYLPIIEMATPECSIQDFDKFL